MQVAQDGQEAFEMIREGLKETDKLFTLIFMDIQMPNLDGIQSTRLIRNIGFTAPIIALTAFADEANRTACAEAGMDYFVAKPIKRNSLKQVLSEISEAKSNPDGRGTDAKVKPGAHSESQQ